MNQARLIDDGVSFASIVEDMSSRPLHEAAPERAGDAIAALGFIFGLAGQWTNSAGLVWIDTENWAGEEGDLSAQGLAAFGLHLNRVVAVRARNAKEALWATEQALATPRSLVIGAIEDREIDLKASRRLLLQAEKTGSRALLLRTGGKGMTPSSAFTRWSVSAAPSTGEDRLLGPPVFRATLLRRRAGAAGCSFDLEWNSHERALRPLDRALAGDLVTPPADRSAAPLVRRFG